MTDKINTGGPAFPVPGLSNLPNDQFIWPETGMTLRDYFAAKAMQGMWASDTDKWQWLVGTPEGLASRAQNAYAMADAMLKARGEGK